MAKGGWTVAEQKPDPIADRLAELDRLIEQQRARLAAMPSGTDANVLERIFEKQDERQRELIAAQKEIAENARPARHSNPDHTHVSAFSYPEGDLKREKPKFLKGATGAPREVFFNNHREREEDLTPAEIDAYNAITKSCEARGGRWTATVKANALYVTIPSYTSDDRQDMHNGLVLNLRELADGPKAVDLVDLVSEVAELRKQLAAQGGLVGATS
jgi:hypothetical protein